MIRALLFAALLSQPLLAGDITRIRIPRDHQAAPPGVAKWFPVPGPPVGQRPGDSVAGRAGGGAGVIRAEYPIRRAVQAKPSAQVARTKNFVVRGLHAQEVADKAELSRRVIAQRFLGRTLPDWSTPARIDSLPGGGDYGGGSTFFFFTGGMPGIEGKWLGNRRTMLENVVPHEVCHTVVASHFKRPTPRWYDEGLAQCVEGRRPQEFHRQLVVQRLQSGRAFPTSKLFGMSEYPRDMSTLYAQGHSVASYLIGLKGPREYIRFGEIGLASGWEKGAAEVYGFRDLKHLQQSWLAWVRAGAAPTYAYKIFPLFRGRT